jgi:cytosine deaminase
MILDLLLLFGIKSKIMTDETTQSDGAPEAILLRHGRLPGQDVADILVRAGEFAEIGPDLAAPPDADIVELGGKLILPGLVDAHCHLDKTLYGGPWVPHLAGDSLADRIRTERTKRWDLGVPNVDRITALLEKMVTAGTVYLRSHIDIAPELGLTGVAAVREACARLGDRVSVELVAFPQYGILREPGTAELMDQALTEGVDVVGGIDPAGMDGDPVRHLEEVFGLAVRRGASVDLHLHDEGSLGTWELELVCDFTERHGLAGRVAVSHAYGLGAASPAEQDRLAERLAETGVSITTAAVYSFPVAPVRRLRAAGVNVACGHDGIRDLWGPYGSGDMLDRAMHLAYRSAFRRDDDIDLALEAATYGGAAMLGLTAYGLHVGAPADLVVVSAESAAAAVITRPVRALVMKGGRVVVRDGELV